MLQLVLQTINRRSCTIMEKAPTRVFSMLKAPTSAFILKTLLGKTLTLYNAENLLTHGK